MRIFKNKSFDQWARKIDLSDEMLIQAIEETDQGHYEAHLAAHLYKKRVALPGRGKRGGARTIIAFKSDVRAFFLYGFAKNKQSSITDKELDALKDLCRDYFNLSDLLIKKMLKDGFFVEIEKL